MQEIDPLLMSELKDIFSLKRLTTRGLFQSLELPEGLVGKQNRRSVKMFRAVLDRALVDTFSIYEDLRTETREWASTENEDFLISCERALLEPDKVLQVFEAFKEILGDTTLE